MDTPEHRVLTTVVGSYPTPAWLVQCPSEQALTEPGCVRTLTTDSAPI